MRCFFLAASLLFFMGIQPCNTISNDECDCFVTNGTNPTYYAEHKLFDFRDLGSYAGVPDVIDDLDDSALAAATSDYFTQDEWTSFWQLQSWDNQLGDGKGLSKDATVVMGNSPNNVYIEEDEDENAASSTHLTMRTKRLRKFQTAAEFQTASPDYQFLSIRVLARTIGSPGACTAIFTYRDSDTLADSQEADIEVLTSGPPDKIQYTNQPSYSVEGDAYPEATSNTTIPGALRWTDWAVHRLDWTPGRTIWYVNGEEMANIEFNAPRDASGVNFNAWSNGGGWTGKMKMHDEVFFQIQWIQVVYNKTADQKGGHHDHHNHDHHQHNKIKRGRSVESSSVTGRRLSPRGQKGCKTVCSIDEVEEAGSISILWEADAGGGLVNAKSARCWGVVWLCVASMFWLSVL